MLESFLRKVKQGETPFYRFIKSCGKMVTAPTLFALPSIFRPPLRLAYQLHFAVIQSWNTLLNVCYRYPLFQARCASIGRGISVDRLPFIIGPVEIHLGNHIWIGGNVTVASGRILDEPPRLILKDHAEVSWGVTIAVNREVLIEEHARVSFNCRISDSDGHPRQADLRAANRPMLPRDIRPVRIGRHAWIGNGTHIMKGVTIGEGAVIGANSVVINDIPPYCLALGNPAEVLLRNFGKPEHPFPPAE